MKRVVFSIRPGFPVIYFRDGWVAGDRSGVFSQVVNYKRHRGRAKDPRAYLHAATLKGQ